MSKDGTITLQPQGFSWDFHDPLGRGSSTWDEITRVEVFKMDLLTTDVVCMNIEFASGDSLSLNEDDVPQFSELIRAMNGRWGLGDQWYRDVVLPPFESRKVVISRSAEGTMVLHRQY